ncbi:N-acetyltransferase [Marivirga tractuosa]|uniref:GCN5-related N-acetyltransferase n=1 Tax=Marivirga tractuosa (strain ATCC 23168 / DSM 4126 / NBRC 15989 / NCIMB 1408 / VKM B-1430 / H-43) TaxID=643867 RepID=E4TM82_MARTH|nr:GNAT family N-acetyltransferase [Marivirga tractuosa]ADR21358.1 GCN5-related N-acetyltransferase [Marivirga tractuosa DSM 4126]BDD14188.1 N-acetyltransferase [Marivirga tractuosa]
MIVVKVVETQDELKQIFAIREEVFVKEQKVAPEEEYDEYEEISTHFIATDDIGNPCGTARWRFTENGMKLERFAVLQSHRGKGVGQALVKAVIDNIKENPKAYSKKMYMHAQIPAVSLYSRFGFEKVGDQFEECNIMHYQMEMMNN